MPLERHIVYSTDFDVGNSIWVMAVAVISHALLHTRLHRAIHITNAKMVIAVEDRIPHTFSTFSGKISEKLD